MKTDADRGIWPCPECRCISAGVKSLLDTVAKLVTTVADIGNKLALSDKKRQEERDAAAAENAALREQNEKLRSSVVTMNEQVTALTWKTFRPSGQSSALLIGSSIIKNVRKENLHDTDVVCLPGGKITDVRNRLEALPNGYDKTLLVGGNDCDVTLPPPAATIVERYGDLLDMAQVKAHKVTISSICPRTTSEDTRHTIDAVNAGLVSLCEEKVATFADNTPSFTLRDGSVNDGYLQPDGVHVTRTAMEKVAKNLGIQVKDTVRGVCGDAVRTREVRQSRPPRNQPGESDDGWQTVRRPPRRSQIQRHTTGRTHTPCFFCGEEGHVMENCRH